MAWKRTSHLKISNCDGPTDRQIHKARYIESRNTRLKTGLEAEKGNIALELEAMKGSFGFEAINGNRMIYPRRSNVAMPQLKNVAISQTPSYNGMVN